MPALVSSTAIPIREQARPPWRRLSRRARRAGGEAVDLYWGSGRCDDAPALAWFRVSALVPLAPGLTAPASILLGDHAEAQLVAERAARLFPEGVSDQLVQLVLRTQSDSPLLLALGAFAEAYADQSERDYSTVRDAAAAGRIDTRASTAVAP
jgi:hypothetical protein